MKTFFQQATMYLLIVLWLYIFWYAPNCHKFKVETGLKEAQTVKECNIYNDDFNDAREDFNNGR